MGDTSLASIMIFAYMSIALLAAVFFRSQFIFLQKLFLPAGFLAGFIMLITGPSMLGIFDIPMGKHIDTYVFHLITAIFIIIGLRGFPAVKKNKTVGTSTLLITKILGVQAVTGLIIALLITLLIQPQLFSGFGSFLMLGLGFDSTVALYFGGFWEEELAFSGGRGIAFSFAVIGFLVAYILGIIMINFAKNKGELSSYPRSEDPAVMTGLVEEGRSNISAGKLTTGSQSIETLTLHIAIIGTVFLFTYTIMRLLARWLVMEFDPGVVIIGEIFMNFNFFFGFIFALLVRRIMKFFNIEYILDEGILNRSLGVAVDYMVVAAIASIPLVISSIRLWETLFIVIIGGIVTMLAVNWLSGVLFRENNSIERKAALFGFVTGNISTSVALLRIVDPEMRHPVMRDLSFAGVLSFLLAIPLIFIMNLPLIGEEVIFQVYGILLSIAYVVILYVIWTLFRMRGRKKAAEE